jgi:hypothetical protein
MQGPNFCLEPNNEPYIPIPTLKNIALNNLYNIIKNLTNFDELTNYHKM